MLQIPLLLAVLFAPLPALAGSSVPAELRVDKEYDQAEASFRRALSGSIAEKRAALDALVALGKPQATGVLTMEYGRTTAAFRGARDKVYKLEIQVDRGEGALADLRLRAERDESLKRVIGNHEEALQGKRTKLRKERKKLDLEQPWRDALLAGMRQLFDGQGSKRKSLEKPLWQELEKGEDLQARLASTEILGAVGGEGTAKRLHKFMDKAVADQAKLRKKLPKAMVDVRKLEQRMQEENNRTGGRRSPALEAQYNQAKTQAVELRRELTFTDYLCDAGVSAAGSALARESEVSLEKTLRDFERTLPKLQGVARMRTLAILGHVDAEPVISSLHEQLPSLKDPVAIAQVLQDLAALGDKALEPLVIEVYLGHSSWHVQRYAAEALATLRSKAGIPALIAALKTAEGRFRSDIRSALRSLTGKDFRTNVALWQRWWDDEGEAFEVPPESGIVEVSESAQREAGVTFFGISTESQRVLFVLDLSGSMEFSMVSRGLPGEEPRNPPKGDEISRLTAAKRDLIQAMGGLHEGALFNLVFYASDVWTWQDDLVEMKDEARGDALATIEGLTAVGGTNIYGALEEAFALAGAEAGGDEWSRPEIDTIYLLSDGQPSVGVTTDPDEILAFVRDINRNAGIVLHTIGLSGAQDAYLLRSLAEQNGGTYAAR